MSNKDKIYVFGRIQTSETAGQPISDTSSYFAYTVASILTIFFILESPVSQILHLRKEHYCTEVSLQ